MISALVVSWQYGHFLDACMGSLLAQTLPFDEILVVDDHSTDNTEVTGRSYAKFNAGVQFVRNSERRGIVWNLNAYLPCLRSEWVVKIDADDWVEPDFVERHEVILREWASDPKLALVYAGATYRATHTPTPRAELNGTTISQSPWHPKTLRRGNYIHGSAVIRKSALVAVGGFPDVPLEEDWQCWLRMADAGFRGLPTGGPPLLNIRLHSSGHRNCGTDYLRAEPGWRPPA